MSNSLELFGIAAMIGVLYLLTKSKSAQAMPVIRLPNVPSAQNWAPPFLPTGAPIYRANVPPGFVLDPNLGTGLVKLADAPYYLNRNTPAYPVAATDLPPSQQPAWLNSNNAIWG